MGLKKKLTKENMKGMSEYSKEKLYQKAADKYGIKYESKSVGGRPGQYSAKDAGMGAKHAVNQAMETDPNFAIAKAMGGTEGDKKMISHFADYKKQGKQANDGEFGGYKVGSKVAANAYQASQDNLRDSILATVDAQTAKTLEQVTRPKGDVQYSDEYAQSRAGEDAYKDFTAGGGYSALMSGDSSVASNFMRRRIDNVKEYLKPNPVSQLGAGLGADGSFGTNQGFTLAAGIDQGRKAGQAFA